MQPTLSPLDRPVDVLVLGAGARGQGYAAIMAQHPELGRVVGVADPDPVRRERMADQHGVPPEHRYASWQEALAAPRFADLAFVTTQDADHVEPAIAAARAGYHLMLEKPMAPTEVECRRIVAAVKDAGVLMAVCHVMRYMPFTVQLQEVLASGVLGEIIGVQHMEPIGSWHFAHSYVRGNWRKESLSSSMLLAKCCHDMDWLRAVVGRPIVRVSSVGSLHHFKAEKAPEGASDRCLTCPSEIERACPYSAKRIYLDPLPAEGTLPIWPFAVLTPDPTRETITGALQTGAYGRCVYHCDNDVVDHQVVTVEFEGGAVATLTASAFTGYRGRETRIMGTHGELYADSHLITVTDLVTGERRTIDTDAAGHAITAGHGGGDQGLVVAVLTALREGRPELVPTGPDESLESHLAVFAAERARREGVRVEVSVE